MIRAAQVSAAIALSFILTSCSTQPTKSSQSAPAADVNPNPPSAESGSHAVVGKALAAVNGVPAIVLLEPQPPRELPPQTKEPVMDQISLTFIPGLLFVRTGQPTEFRNSDETLHNINVKEDATKEQAFNIAIPTGVTYNHTFKRDGFYTVVCDIHPTMAATFVSISTPYATIADVKGNFIFDDVAPGAYAVTVHAGNQRLTRLIEVAGPRTEVNIEGS